MGHKTSRLSRKVEQFRKLNYWIVGGEFDNAGTNLTVGQEWTTPDGFVVRQISVNRVRNTGRVLVLRFASEVVK